MTVIPRGNKEIKSYNYKICRQNSKGAFYVEGFQGRKTARLEWLEQLARNQEAAEHEEKINPSPAIGTYP